MSESEIPLQGPLMVRSPNWLGDAVMALPAVRNLKDFIEDEPLTVAAPDKLAALWQKCPFVDNVISLDKPKNLKASVAQLREGAFASAVLLPNSLRAATEAWMAKYPQRIGYARSGRSMLLTHGVPVPPRNPARMHQRYYYLDLISALGAPDDPSLPKLRKDPTTVGGMRGLVLAFCPGAEYGPAKRWPVENFIELARHFIATRKAKILLLGAPVDMPVAEEFVKHVPEADNRVGKTTLAEFMALLVTARLVICNDSGAMHVASALGVPTMTVFGSTEPALTGPMGARIRVLRHHVPCSPCFLRECPIDFSCMKGISAEQGIFAARDHAAMKISACLITLNEERNLPRCLESVAPLVDEIVVIDSGSTDATAAIAQKFGARVIHQNWLGYVGQKNFALAQAAHPWVLSIDADEEISSTLARFIEGVKEDAKSVAPGAPVGYEFSRLVFYRNKWVRHGDWYPDRLVRLFRRDKARFTGGRVHEKLELDGDFLTLPGHLHHFTYENATDRAARCAKYAELWAQTAHEQHRRAGPLSGPLHAAARFLKGYVLKRGFLDGAVGWDVATGNAREVWLKYTLLRKLNRAAQTK